MQCGNVSLVGMYTVVWCADIWCVGECWQGAFILEWKLDFFFTCHIMSKNLTDTIIDLWNVRGGGS